MVNFYFNFFKLFTLIFVRYCGTTFPPNLQSRSNELFIKFHSDGSEVRGGFLISYKSQLRYCSLSVCKEGEGDCAIDSECEESLVCGYMNCANNSLQHCCTKICYNDSDCVDHECNIEKYQCRLDSYGTNWSNCSQDTPCNQGEGDCDQHTDCDGQLLCGVDNCDRGSVYLDCCTGSSFV